MTPNPPHVVQQDALQFLRALPPDSIDELCTDPAYSGMNQHLKLGRGKIIGTYKDKGEGGKWFEEFHDTPENYQQFLTEVQRVLRPNRGLFLMFDPYSLLTLGPIVRDYFDVKNLVVWDKVNIGLGRNFRRMTEMILYATKGRAPLSRKDIPDVWRIKRVRALYPTQKPVEVFESMLVSCKPKVAASWVVCDPFCGSGSSAIAALRQGCDFLGCDISEKAVGLTRDRIKTFLETGLDPLQPKSAETPLQRLKWLD